MPTFSQAGRFMAVTTPLGPDKLLLERLAGTEGLSELFEFELDMLAEADTAVPFDQLLGQPASVRFDLPGGGTRYLSGIVGRLAQGAEVPGPRGGGTFVRYTATLVPKLWLLTRQARSRIFQQESVPDILKKVLAGLDAHFDLKGTFHPRDYCTQYRETDFAFASRLMEEEGIYYYFRHADGGHTLVVANHPGGHDPVPGPAELTFDTIAGGNRPDDRVYGWAKWQEVRSGGRTLWDHSFEMPGKNLEAKQPIQDAVAVGAVTHKLKVGGNDKLEWYDYPGGYAQRFDGVAPGGGDRAADVQKILQDNVRTAALQQQREAAAGLRTGGDSTCRQLTAGHAFALARHPDADGDYVVTRVTHRASLAGAYDASGGGGDGYHNTFEAIPAGLPFRPPAVTPKARVYGTQTAVVVGPAGEEIFTDKYGRVKVQLPWDRDGNRDQNSACWVRVATPWAGGQWGAYHIPRVGMEVVLAYEEGDPDRPIVVGCVYNAENMPPYALPDHRTKSGIKSRSTLKGTANNFNEIRFEDKKGGEQIYVHAERDFDRVVENNDTHKVGFQDKADGDQTVAIFNNQSVTVGGGKADAKDGSQAVDVFNNQVVTVGSGKAGAKDGSHTMSIWKDRTVTLDTGNDKLTVGKGDRAVVISMGKDTLSIKMGDQLTKLDLGSSKTEAMMSIELKVGQSSITLDQTGVTIKGIMVKVEGQAMAQLKAPMTQVSGDAMLTLKGGIAMIN